MNIQLLEGEFNIGEAMTLITAMIQIKVKYHENKIKNCDSEEDIKQREAKIKRLQKELYELREQMKLETKSIKLSSNISVN